MSLRTMQLVTNSQWNIKWVWKKKVQEKEEEKNPDKVMIVCIFFISQEYPCRVITRYSQSTFERVLYTQKKNKLSDKKMI